tara:strand:- start:2072 stop:3955 length:1884 start_codon:yes stop_codon:yes gene_type:complete
VATNKKISDLTELVEADLASDDVLPIVDVSAGTTHKVRKDTLSSALSGVSSISATTPIAVDSSTGAVTVSTGTVPVASGGTGATSLTDGGVLLGSGTGAVTAMAVLTDGQMIVGDGSTDPVAESGATLRTSIGVGTGDSPQFTAVNVGAATDTTVARASAGDINVEGNIIYRAGGTDVPVTDGGTGASSLTDGGVLLGSGTAAVTAMAVLTDGQMIVGDGSGDPVAESGATLRTSIGVGTGDSPEFTKVTVTGDTSTGDDAAMGYTAAEGLILTGQGSTNDITIKNDADTDVLKIPTGTTNVDIVGVVSGTSFTGSGAGLTAKTTPITTLNVAGGTEVTVASGDSIIFGDLTDSGNIKRDTVQGILDLASASDVQTFTSSGTWTKASGTTYAFVDGWGGGGSGSRVSSSVGGAGGGGATYSWALLAVSDLGSTETVTIGAGGAAITSDTTDGNAGGNTTLGSKFTIYGGGGGANGGSGGGGGGGGSPVSIGGTLSADVGANAGTFGGAGGSANNDGTANWFGGGGGGKEGDGGRAGIGGGGGGGGSNSTDGADGGASLFGAGGGGGGETSGGTAGGVSVHGGNGGAGGVGSGTAGTTGTVPGGGGGGAGDGSNSGAGGNGTLRVISW